MMHFYAPGWLITAYYADDVKLPKKPNELAMQVWCGSESVKNLEVKVFNERDDIGTVVVQEVGNR